MVCGFGNHRGSVGEGLLETRWDRDWSGGVGGSQKKLHQVRLVLICSVVFQPKIGFRMSALEPRCAVTVAKGWEGGVG